MKAEGNKVTRRIFACVSDQGTAMLETALNEDEMTNPELKAQAERAALLASDCSRIEWHDVTDNEAFS